MTSKDLTVIITTFKSEDKIDNCLNSIDPNIRIIIVENSNNQKFKNYIENKFQNTECILANANLGYGKANNLGLKKVKTKYSLILNPDTVLENDSLRNFFISVKENLNFAILGPLQINKELTLENINKYNNFSLIETDSIHGHAIFLNMEKFLDIGFFDEKIFLYLEETDLCKRIKKINEKIYIDPNIKIFHFGAKAVNEIFSYQIELTRNWHWMWSLFYYNKKHFNYFNALMKVSPIFFSALFKCLFYKVISNNRKKEIYSQRLSGLINSILGKSSWYRPTLD